ncbi:FtsK/SpoIIIE domain-containing protein [Neisseria musculi]|uniref:FtsK/SpoIIIE family protein n=1 Tax=Neisseria musculi TaxID=1815583 RepID=A0A7H1M8C8_9NEIS|nr:FtsK/SpoIIIE domain-containing protein [Neisseria musculi]QNT57893.1 ftsK/SpoIIIE family protein [Neisseria musculi]
MPCYNNESHAYDVKLLRDEKTWHKLDVEKFAEALQNYDKDYTLPVCIGIDEYGEAHFKDLASAPHLLIGGTTGSGKSVFVRTLLRSLFDLCKGQDKMEVAILDPKKVDYRIFETKKTSTKSEFGTITMKCINSCLRAWKSRNAATR